MILDQILDTLTAERWEYYLNQVLPVDEVIILKLQYGSTMLERWQQIVSKYNLEEKTIKNHLVSRLIQASAKGNSTTVKEKARELYDKIR